MVRLWIDTDVGDNPDDAIALLCARAHPDVELVGISTVEGDPERRVQVAAALVDAPIYSGAAPELGAAFAASAPDALLAIGPLTNVAALARGMVMPPVTLMGGVLGTIRYRGERRRVEHNFGRDPIAAAQVVATCRDLLVVPLDVTASMRLDGDALTRLLSLAPELVEPVEDWLDALRRTGTPSDERSVCLHDPLAFLTLVAPELVEIERRSLAVEADGRLVERSDGPASHVVRRVDAPRAIAAVLGLLARGMG